MSGEITTTNGGGSLVQLDRDTIDVQIATAHRYPRDPAKALERIHAMAVRDPETSGSMMYALRRTKRNRQTGEEEIVWIEGPSARFAEIVAWSWGNLRFDASIIGEGPRSVTAQACGWDLEQNVAKRVTVERGILTSAGKRYSDDMIAMTKNAAISLATRNVTWQVVPFGLVKSAYEAARHNAIGQAELIDTRRQRAFSWFERIGIQEARVLRALGIESAKHITDDHLLILQGLRNRLREGEITLEDAFPAAASPKEELTARLAAAAKQDHQIAQETSELARAKAERVRDHQIAQETPPTVTPSPETTPPPKRSVPRPTRNRAVETSTPAELNSEPPSKPVETSTTGISNGGSAIEALEQLAREGTVWLRLAALRVAMLSAGWHAPAVQDDAQEELRDALTRASAGGTLEIEQDGDVTRYRLRRQESPAPDPSKTSQAEWF